MPEPVHERADQDSRLGITVATYNIHQCVGGDGRRDPKRVLRVLRELRADVIGLQEVHSEEGPTPDLAQLDYLARGVDLTPLAGPTMLRGNGQYGNALLSKFPVLERKLLDISVRGREPRGAIDAVLGVDHHLLRIVVTHLGLHARERRVQVGCILEALGSSPDIPLVVLADMNEWFPLAGTLRRFSRHFKKIYPPATYPSRFPVLSLDRIWVHRGATMERLEAHRTTSSRNASDHLPLKAWIRLNSDRMGDG